MRTERDHWSLSRREGYGKWCTLFALDIKYTLLRYIYWRFNINLLNLLAELILRVTNERLLTCSHAQWHAIEKKSVPERHGEFWGKCLEKSQSTMELMNELFCRILIRSILQLLANNFRGPGSIKTFCRFGVKVPSWPLFVLFAISPHTLAWNSWIIHIPDMRRRAILSIDRNYICICFIVTLLLLPFRFSRFHAHTNDNIELSSRIFIHYVRLGFIEFFYTNYWNNWENRFNLIDSDRCVLDLCLLLS